MELKPGSESSLTCTLSALTLLATEAEQPQNRIAPLRFPHSPCLAEGSYCRSHELYAVDSGRAFKSSKFKQLRRQDQSWMHLHGGEVGVCQDNFEVEGAFIIQVGGVFRMVEEVEGWGGDQRFGLGVS